MLHEKRTDSAVVRVGSFLWVQIVLSNPFLLELAISGSCGPKAKQAAIEAKTKSKQQKNS